MRQVKAIWEQCKEMFRLCCSLIPSIHPAGKIFVYIFAAIAAVSWAICTPFGIIGSVLFLWCCYFFRDPARVTPVGDHFVISPADGVVQKIEKAAPPKELEMGTKKRTRISIFLNVFDVHVNRVPISGTITNIFYHPGKFLSANLDKASEENERNAMVITHKDGKDIICVQIAGLVARRIICNAEDGQEVTAGERYGIIRFGSRADIYLPEGVNALVVEGQYALGGETILADFKGKHTQRKGRVS